MSPILGIYASQISGHLTPPDTGAMFPLGMVQVGSGGTSFIEFTSIPSTYKHLQIRAFTSNASYPASGAYLFCNSDTTQSNYRDHYLFGNGTSASAGTDGNSAANGVMGNAMSTGPAAWVIDILDYTSTSKYKTIRMLNGYDANGSGQIWFGSVLWMNTAAVSAFRMTTGAGNWAQYSSFALYGIKGA